MFGCGLSELVVLALVMTYSSEFVVLKLEISSSGHLPVLVDADLI